MATITRRGERIVELLIPEEFQGRKIEAVAFQPFRLDHRLRWQEGAFKSALGLAAELCGETEDQLRNMTIIDSERVMQEFLLHVPPEIRSDIEQGRIPIKANGQAPAAPDRPADYIEELDSDLGFDIGAQHGPGG